MQKSGIPPDLVHFIRERIDSVHTLQILLFLHQQRGRSWAAQEVHDHVKSTAQAAQQSLETLVKHGFAKVDGAPGHRFQYQPGSSDMDRLVQDLSHAYSERSTAVIEVIYTKPQAARSKPLER